MNIKIFCCPNDLLEEILKHLKIVLNPVFKYELGGLTILTENKGFIPFGPLINLLKFELKSIMKCDHFYDFKSNSWLKILSLYPEESKKLFMRVN